jgi:hypothetical protein
MIILTLLAFLYVVIDAVRDNIAHYDSYIGSGYFFSREAYHGPEVKGFKDKYFPMFRDFWHGGKTIQYAIVSVFFGLLIGNWIQVFCWFILSQLLFLYYYKYNKNIAFKLVVVIIFLLIIFDLTSCNTIRKSRKVEKQDSSSVVTNKNTAVFDSAAYLAGVKMGTKVINPCDSNGKLKPINQTTTNGHGTSRIYTKHDTLFVDCECEGTVNRLRIEISSKDSTISKLQKEKEVSDKAETKIEQRIPWYFKYALAGLAILVIILGLWIFKLKTFK